MLAVIIALPPEILLVTDKLPSVPTLVKLDVTTVDFNIVPLKLPAFAVIATLAAAVN